MKKLNRQDIVRLVVEQGLTQREAARRFGCSPRTVFSALREQGVEARQYEMKAPRAHHMSLVVVRDESGLYRAGATFPYYQVVDTLGCFPSGVVFQRKYDGAVFVVQGELDGKQELVELK